MCRIISKYDIIENSEKKEIIIKNNISEIMPLIYSTEIRDAYTRGHSENVAYYAKHLALALKLREEECEDVYIAGLLHDIGKIGVPDSILLKPTKLEMSEFELIKMHSYISGQIIEKSESYSYLKDAVKHHHENYDGSGYPDGLKGEEIPLYSRILSIADVFDALTTSRIYRASMSFNDAISIMDDMQKKNKFDPQLYKTFLVMIKKLGIIKKNKYKKIEFEGLEEQRNSFFFTDSLTKLLNRDALLSLLRKSYDYEYKVSLIECNLKAFKEYNKSYGLKKGDVILKKIADHINHKLSAIIKIKNPQQKDLFLFRLHADKFAILYIGQRGEYLSYKLNKIQDEIKEKFEIDFEYSFIIRDKNISKNIERDIGYLL